MEQKMTMQELADFINAQEGDFLIHAELGEGHEVVREVKDGDEKRPAIQT